MPMPPQQPPPARPALPGRPSEYSPGAPAPGLPGREDEEPGCACPPGQDRPLPDPAAVRLFRVPDSAPPYDVPGCYGPAAPSGAAAGHTGGSPWAGQEPPAGGADATGQDRQAGGTGGTGQKERADGADVASQDGRAGGTGSAGQEEPAGGAEATTEGGHTAEGGHAAEADSASQDERRIGQEKRSGHAAGSPGSGREDGTGPGQQPSGWPGRFAQVLAETLAGTRPARQIRPWTTERARTHIQRLGAQMSGGQQPRIRRVIISSPACNVVEMTVVVGFGPRVRALAVRLEHAEAALIPGRPPRTARWLCTAVEAA